MNQSMASRADSDSTRGLWRTFAALRSGNYRYLWLSQLASAAAWGLETVAQGWLVLQLSDSPFVLGAAYFCRFIPLLVFTPLMGVVTDRFDRRKLLVAIWTIATLIALVYGILVVSNLITIWHVLLLSLAYGAAMSLDAPAHSALMPSLVPKERLSNAISLSFVAWNIMGIVGPFLAGMLIEAIGLGGVLMARAGLLAFSALALLLIRLESIVMPVSTVGFFQHLGEGLEYIRNTPAVLIVVTLPIIPFFFGLPYGSLLPVFARDILQIGASGLGFLNAALGLGGLTGSLALANRRDIKRKGVLLLATVFIWGLLLTLFAVSRWTWVSVVSLAIIGIMQSGFMATTVILIQTTVPDKLRGRVLSIRFMQIGLTPISSLLVGYLATVSSAPWAVGVTGVICVSAVLVISWLVPRVRQLE